MDSLHSIANYYYYKQINFNTPPHAVIQMSTNVPPQIHIRCEAHSYPQSTIYQDYCYYYDCIYTLENLGTGFWLQNLYKRRRSSRRSQRN